jgi:hypothetical protein
VQLVPADAGNGAGRSANLRRIVRKRGDVVAVQRYGIRKLIPGDLHAVAGVSGKADDRLIDHFALRFRGRVFYKSGHMDALLPSGPVSIELRSGKIQIPGGECGPGIFPTDREAVDTCWYNERWTGAEAKRRRPTTLGYHTTPREAGRDSTTLQCVLSKITPRHRRAFR